MKYFKNERGFTLVEMLIVMLVISVLLIITVPNITKNQEVISGKGNAAYEKMVEGQVQSYKLKFGKIPTLAELEKEYGVDGVSPDGRTITIQSDGTVKSESATKPQ